MTPNLYQLLTALATRDARRSEFRAAVRQISSILREPSMLLMAGAVAGATVAAVVAAVAR